MRSEGGDSDRANKPPPSPPYTAAHTHDVPPPPLVPCASSVDSSTTCVCAPSLCMRRHVSRRPPKDPRRAANLFGRRLPHRGRVPRVNRDGRETAAVGHGLRLDVGGGARTSSTSTSSACRASRRRVRGSPLLQRSKTHAAAGSEATKGRTSLTTPATSPRRSALPPGERGPHRACTPHTVCVHSSHCCLCVHCVCVAFCVAQVYASTPARSCCRRSSNSPTSPTATWSCHRSHATPPRSATSNIMMGSTRIPTRDVPSAPLAGSASRCVCGRAFAPPSTPHTVAPHTCPPNTHARLCSLCGRLSHKLLCLRDGSLRVCVSPPPPPIPPDGAHVPEPGVGGRLHTLQAPRPRGEAAVKQGSHTHCTHALDCTPHCVCVCMHSRPHVCALCV